jgi:ABC-type dipeptide/oligopeptide/nickel transport system permease component
LLARLDLSSAICQPVPWARIRAAVSKLNEPGARVPAAAIGVDDSCLFGVATLVFSLIHLVPGDPAQACSVRRAGHQDLRYQVGAGPAAARTVRRLLARRGSRRSDVVPHRTNRYQHDRQRMPATIQLALAAMVVTIVVPCRSASSAVRRGTLVDPRP